ncbi:MAG: SPOR domain-containing protein [Pseudomonadota bacterium]
MLRLVVIVLIAANVLYFGWSHWAVQDKPVLTAVAAPDAARKKPATPPPPPPCATLGPFRDELMADQGEKQLTKAGWKLQRRTLSEDVDDGWWVYVPTPNALEQARTLTTLRRAGQRDSFSMADDPEFRVSVGLFSDEARAEDRASKVQRLHLDATVKERRKQQISIWFDLPGVARETLSDGRLNATGLPLDVLRIESCPPPAAKESPATAPASKPEEAAPSDKNAAPAAATATGVAATRNAREIRERRV